MCLYLSVQQTLPTWYSPFEKYVIHHMKICVYHAKPFNIHFEASAFFYKAYHESVQKSEKNTNLKIYFFTT